jgi:hypothetical protein
MRVSAALVVLAMLGGCGGNSTSDPRLAPVTAPPHSGLDANAAQALLARAVAPLTHGVTRYRIVVRVQNGGVLETQTGVADAANRRWQTTLTAGGTRTLRFIGTTQALYLTSPTWPASERGRWLRYGPTELGHARGDFGPPDLAGGLPEVLEALSQLRAISGQQVGSGALISASLPGFTALGLAGARPGLAAARVTPSQVTARAQVTIHLGPNARLEQLQIPPGSLDEVASGLPDELRVLNKLVFTSLFDVSNAPVQIHVPVGKEILPH